MIHNKLKFVGMINIRRGSQSYLFLCYQKFTPVHKCVELFAWKAQLTILINLEHHTVFQQWWDYN